MEHSTPIEEIECLGCGSTLPKKKRGWRLYCAKSCHKKHVKSGRYDEYLNRIRSCGHCKKEYTRKQRYGKYCSKKCTIAFNCRHNTTYDKRAKLDLCVGCGIPRKNKKTYCDSCDERKHLK